MLKRKYDSLPDTSLGRTIFVVLTMDSRFEVLEHSHPKDSKKHVESVFPNDHSLEKENS